MKINTWSKNMRVSDRMKMVADRRVSYALRAFKRYIRSVDVFLSDVDGPRVGKDKHCRITVTLERFGQIIINQYDIRTGAAIARAAERVKTNLGKKLERRKEHREERLARLHQIESMA